MKEINLDWIKQHVHPRQLASHKKTFGHVLVVAGSEGKAGAAILCASAALHSGCGMVTAMIPKDAYQVLLKDCPELMYLQEGLIRNEHIEKFDAIVIGPGLGFSEHAKQNVKFILENYTGPVVIDADALSIVAANAFSLKSNHIVTPHPGEFSRLQGFEYDANNRIGQAKIFIQQHAAVLVLKGAGTLVGSPSNELMQNTTGNDGMATAGSGDVLAGIIVSLCAQGYAPFIAAAVGVYLHGLAGDTAIKDISKASLVATDLIRYLGKCRLID